MTDDSDQNKKETQRAIALRYTDIDELPQVIAKGAGEIANKIVALAKEHGVPVQKDDSLADILSKLDTGSLISQESYRLVAEVISFLYFTDQKWRESHSELGDILGPPEELLELEDKKDED